jgi:hypothetical protein
MVSNPRRASGKCSQRGRWLPEPIRPQQIKPEKQDKKGSALSGAQGLSDPGLERASRADSSLYSIDGVALSAHRNCPTQGRVGFSLLATEAPAWSGLFCFRASTESAPTRRSDATGRGRPTSPWAPTMSDPKVSADRTRNRQSYDGHHSCRSHSPACCGC